MDLDLSDGPNGLSPVRGPSRFDAEAYPGARGCTSGGRSEVKKFSIHTSCKKKFKRRIIVANGEIKNIVIVGTGVIGASWAAYYLSRGFNVIATDPKIRH